MNFRIGLILLLFAAALPLFARDRAVRPAPGVLWIGAHPDDEILIAPLLGRECAERGGACALLVMTRGEGGGDAAVRAAEMQRAAELLHASLTLWTLPDVLSGVETAWAAAAGGRDALVARIATEIAARAPRIVVTFDPRHGSTCHPAHRALGALVVEAMARLETPLPLYFVETTSSFRSAVAQPIVIDISPQWSYLVRDAQAHTSQFPAQQVEALAALPAEQRRVWLIDAAAAPAYTFACP